MDPALASIIVALIGSGGLAGGLSVFWKSPFGGKTENPVTDEELASERISPAYQFIIEQVKELRDDLDEERAEHHDTRAAMGQMQKQMASDSQEIYKLRLGLQNFVSWYHDLRNNWDYYRAQIKPPNPPEIDID